jgi:phosphate transport system ATP-binding protein
MLSCAASRTDILLNTHSFDTPIDPAYCADTAPLQAELGDSLNALHPAPDTDSTLEVHGLDVSYGGLPALAGIYCHFPEKSVTAIMGPSGCGKSTLVKALNRTLELTSEVTIRHRAVFLHGVDIYGAEVDAKIIRKHIGIIHQRPVVFPMSILENVLFGAKFFHLLDGASPRQYAERYLERVGLLDEISDRLHEPAHKLSGGQQQRLCLARTLANKPEIILMDEPCSAIDPVATQRIEDLVAELKRDYTIIIVTHNLQQARRVSEQAILMLGGRIVEAGPTQALFENPRTQIAREFISGAIG